MAKILHVEDDLEWHAWVAEALEERGHEVTSFATLEEAREAAEETRYDVFICDGTVGRESGADWASQLQMNGYAAIILSRTEPLPTTPVPFVNKKTWVRGGKERLVGLVNQLAAK